MTQNLFNIVDGVFAHLWTEFGNPTCQRLKRSRAATQPFEHWTGQGQ